MNVYLAARRSTAVRTSASLFWTETPAPIDCTQESRVQGPDEASSEKPVLNRLHSDWSRRFIATPVEYRPYSPALYLFLSTYAYVSQIFSFLQALQLKL
jgi:hypothetical protein